MSKRGSGMKRVTGIGGVFFKCKDPETVKAWYAQHLGLNMEEHGTSFEWRQVGSSRKKGFTVWGPFKETTDYFEPSTKEFMINFRVQDLDALLEALQQEGVEIVGGVQTFDYGKFAHVLDPEGNKIELWQPGDSEYAKLCKGKTTF